MVELPYLTVVLVSLAAGIYVLKEAKHYFTKAVMAYIELRVGVLKHLHEATYNAIKTEFDFWWSGDSSQRLRKHLTEKMPIPPELREQMPSEMLDVMISPQMDEYRDIALHLATHARMGDGDLTLIHSLPKFWGLRRIAIEQREEHQADLDEDRAKLIEAGVDTIQLESHFAPSDQADE